MTSSREGEVLRGYRLLRRLGEGAAGEVYLATPNQDKQFAASGQPVAVKLYKPEILRRDNQFERIRREFEVGTHLTHPNLVEMYESNISQEQDPFLVMEFVDGLCLDSWITMFNPLPGPLSLHLLEQLVDVVGYVHEHDLIHRDIKPSNIMVTSDFHLKLMDFGVVTALGKTQDDRITPTDEFLGSIRNSSPEFLFGLDYDLRTDLYSVGTVLFALLHGEGVFADIGRPSPLSDAVKNEMPRFDSSIGERDEASRSLLELSRHLLRKEQTERPQTKADISAILSPIRELLQDSPAPEPLYGYVATALSGLGEEAREAMHFVTSKIAEVAKGFGVYVYQPRRATDPILHETMDAEYVYAQDRTRVIESDILFVVANKPSFGVGQEVEIASSFGKPAVLITREGVRVSRMLVGGYLNFVGEITYRSPEDLDRELRRLLGTAIAPIRTNRGALFRNQRVSMAVKLQRLRHEVGYTNAAELAQEAGISPRMLEAMERGHMTSTSLELMSYLASFLGVSLADLIDDESKLPKPPVRDDVNIRRLEQLAKEVDMSAHHYLTLRDEYRQSVAASGEPPTLDRDSWMRRYHLVQERQARDAEQQHWEFES